MKTAPSFAKDNSEYKIYLREFYQREEEERLVLPGYEMCDSKQMAKMTHVEFFSYPVWDRTISDVREVANRRLENHQPILFDYKERSAITKDCRYVLL